MLTLETLKLLVSAVKFRDWQFHVWPHDLGFILQVSFYDHGDLQSGRKWYVSAHSTPGEVVQTAFKAIITAVEHEAREEFTYQGLAIFGPHYSLDALVKLALDKANIQERAPRCRCCECQGKMCHFPHPGHSHLSTTAPSDPEWDNYYKRVSEFMESGERR